MITWITIGGIVIGIVIGYIAGDIKATKPIKAYFEKHKEVNKDDRTRERGFFGRIFGFFFNRRRYKTEESNRLPESHGDIQIQPDQPIGETERVIELD